MDLPEEMHGDIRPIPDPTVLTTAQLLREMSGLKELIFTRLDGMDRAIALQHEDAVRIPTDFDKEIAHLRSSHEDRFAAVAATIDQLRRDLVTSVSIDREIDDEKFTGIDRQLRDRLAFILEKFVGIQTLITEQDIRAQREILFNKSAVDAAFAAQKEAVQRQDESNQKAIDKAERGTTETLNKQADLFRSAMDAMSAQISDIKDRINRIEARGIGVAESSVSHRADSGLDLTRAGVILSLIGLVAVLIHNFGR